MDMHTHLVGDIQSSNVAAPLLSSARARCADWRGQCARDAACRLHHGARCRRLPRLHRRGAARGHRSGRSGGSAHAGRGRLCNGHGRRRRSHGPRARRDQCPRRCAAAWPTTRRKCASACANCSAAAPTSSRSSPPARCSPPAPTSGVRVHRGGNPRRGRGSRRARNFRGRARARRRGHQAAPCAPACARSSTALTSTTKALRLMRRHGTYLVADIYNGDYIDEIGRRDGWPRGNPAQEYRNHRHPARRLQARGARGRATSPSAPILASIRTGRTRANSLTWCAMA